MTTAERAIENLIARYAELVDDGDFAGVGELPAHGGDAIARMLRETVIVYSDGTPRTKHVTTTAGGSPSGRFASISSAT